MSADLERAQLWWEPPVDPDEAPAPPPGPYWMTAPEIAACLRMSITQVQRHLRAGRFEKAMQTPGGRWRVPRPSVAAAMAAGFEPRTALPPWTAGAEFL